MRTTFDKRAKNAPKPMHPAADAASHESKRARSVPADAFRAAVRVVGVLRDLGVTDALGWFALYRRRGTTMSMATFGAGFLAGSAAGVLLAPSSGPETRRWIAQQISSIFPDHEVEPSATTERDDLAEPPGNGAESTATGSAGHQS